jgi:hypothetical protein
MWRRQQGQLKWRQQQGHGSTRYEGTYDADNADRVDIKEDGDVGEFVKTQGSQVTRWEEAKTEGMYLMRDAYIIISPIESSALE